jgi:hypothetical protein
MGAPIAPDGYDVGTHDTDSYDGMLNTCVQYPLQ